MVPIARVLLLFLLVQKGRSWFSCDDVEFCTRIRYKEPNDSWYIGNIFSDGNPRDYYPLYKGETDKKLDLFVTLVADNTIRVTIDDPINPRHRVRDALDGIPQLVEFETEKTSEGEYTIKAVGRIYAKILTKPFRVFIYGHETFESETVLATINYDGRAVFEEQEPEVGVGIGITLFNAKRVYGLPSHADRLPLRSTKSAGLDPYRFYNIDHGDFGTNSTQALYGSIPVLYAFNSNESVGVYWQNSAQTFVDIENEEDSVSSYFFSESGIIDMFVFTGDLPRDVVREFSRLSGRAPVPPYFALGYHQSRYSYYDAEDVRNVVTNFDENNFPLDVVWLDIDYTDAKKYFTWNPENFSDPIGLQDFLRSTGRKLVVIIDPHISVEDGYFVYDESEANGYFVKDAEGNSYRGQCWPGISSWIDFFNPEARDYWSSLFAFDKFQGTTDIVHIWNDMNEPAVFEGYEGSMPKDNVHYGGWLHRDVHNQYGFYQTQATYKGLVDRSNGEQRPFLLTRSHFAGSQRFAAMWTGDNLATFQHLSISIPMCLSSALVGLSFCGADIGGFHGNPRENLLVRWYQAAAWLPFFRQHSADNTKRREPYLYDSEMQFLFRYAIELRYKHLPYWYTLFYEHRRTGEPVIKPLIYNYHDDDNLADLDRQWFVGDNVIVSPVLDAGEVGLLTFYLPGGQNQLWFDVENTLLYRGIGYYTREGDLSSNNYFYRGGSIVPRRDTIRSSSVYTLDDPIDLYVFLDENSEAEGTLYVDDATSFKYQNDEYLYVRYSFADNAISASKIDEYANYDGPATIGRIVIYRPPSGFKSAIIHDNFRTTKEVTVDYETEGRYLQIEGLNVDTREPFVIQFV